MDIASRVVVVAVAVVVVVDVAVAEQLLRCASDVFTGLASRDSICIVVR
jgi:hypothetical protein